MTDRITVTAAIVVIAVPRCPDGAPPSAQKEKAGAVTAPAKPQGDKCPLATSRSCSAWACSPWGVSKGNRLVAVLSAAVAALIMAR